MTVPDPSTLAELFGAGGMRRMFDVLARQLPCTIELLYGVFVVQSRFAGSRRDQQQRIGGSLAKINRILKPHGWIVRPADPRGTYQLVRL